MEQVTSTAELTGYFRSFGVRAAAELDRLVRHVRDHQAADESALACADRLMGEWLRRHLGDYLEPGVIDLHRARAAVVLSGLGEARPELMLAETLPASWLLPLREALPRPTPTPQWGQMSEQSLSPAPALDAVRRFVVPVGARGEDGSEVAR